MKKMPNPISQYIGSQLREARKSRGFTQKELGDAVGISQSQIQKYEKGENSISCSLLWVFSQLLRVNVSFIFEKETYGDDLEKEKESLELMRLWHSIEDADIRKSIITMLHAIAEGTSK